MKNNNVLNVRELHNSDINSKECKFCAYNCENGCPSDQSACWFCKDKSEFQTAPFLEGLESMKLKTFSHLLPFGKDYSKVQSLISLRTELCIAIVACDDNNVLLSLCRAYSSLNSIIDSFIQNS